MEYENNCIKLVKSKIFSDHIFVILLFVALTGIFTYPSYVYVDKLIGGYGDPAGFMNVMWWYHHNITNPSSSPNGFSWLFYDNYLFYPIGASLHDGANFDTYISIFLLPVIGNIQILYNLMIYSTFVITGYGMFLLVKHLTKSYLPSIVGSIIFTFSTFHMIQATGHITYATVDFIPFSILYLIKTVESKSIKFPIVGGIFLFLILITALYFALFMLLFIFAFFVYLLIHKEKSSIFLRILFLSSISISLAFPFYYSEIKSSYPGSIFVGEPLGSFVDLSADITDYLLPTSMNTISKFVHYPWGTSVGIPETWVFVGYVALILAIIAIIKTDMKKKSLWIIAGILLGIISLGPFLKVHGFNTHVPLPYYFLYKLPFFDLFRAIGRSSVIVILCISILASYGINEIFKIFKMNNYKKILFVSVIACCIIFESLMIPYPISDPLPISGIYRQISSDRNFSAVLETPIGEGYNSFQEGKYSSNQYYLAYQTIHEKPIYSGHLSRVSEPTQRYLQTYFLNQFIWDQSSDDIVKQDTKKVGISLLNYFNIGYIIVHSKVSPDYSNIMQEYVTDQWYPQTISTLFDIFSRHPDYQDSELLAYKIPKSNSSTPFIVLGDGWSPFYNGYRSFGSNAIIKIINPDNKIVSSQLEIQLMPIVKSKLSFTFNRHNMSSAVLDNATLYLISTGVVYLNPGDNILEINSEVVSTNFPVISTSRDPVIVGTPISSLVTSVKFSNQSVNSFHIGYVNATNMATMKYVPVHQEITQVFNKVLNRNPTPNELTIYSEKLVDYHLSPQWLESTLQGYEEYKIIHSQN